MKARLFPYAVALLLIELHPAAAVDAPAPPQVQRLAIVAGANHGAKGRVALRYAVADAERFAQVVTGMGGVRAADCLVLREPTRQDFLSALEALRARASGLKSHGARVDVMVYYSGHADETGLMLGPDALSYAELRDAVRAIDADVGITILDACASGAITRLKGGQPHPAFLTDVSSDVRGYAFLTASSGDEAAQESDRLRGSFFTHALLTALRGAADASGDGKVSLGEAYQFAFSETLAQTTPTEAGAQHPSYDIKMAGTGDVVLTDLRETSSSVIFGADYDGRFFVLDSKRQLVAELYKPHGRPIELALEPGEYEIYFAQDKDLYTSTVSVAEGQRRELERDELHASDRLPTQSRGESLDPTRFDLLDGRTRLQLLVGLSSVSVRSGIDEEAVNVEASGGLAVSYWFRPDLAADAMVVTFGAGAETLGDELVKVRALVALLLGMRYAPPMNGFVRPYLAAGVGPFFDTRVTEVGFVDTTEVDVDPGAALGGGVELYFGRSFSASVDGRVSLVVDRDPDYHLMFGLGWTFGKGRFKSEK